MCPDLLHPLSRPLDTWEITSRVNPVAQKVGLIFLTNVFLTVRALSLSFFFRTLWVLSSCVSSLQTLKFLNKLYHLFLARDSDSLTLGWYIQNRISPLLPSASPTPSGDHRCLLPAMYLCQASVGLTTNTHSPSFRNDSVHSLAVITRKQRRLIGNVETT